MSTISTSVTSKKNGRPIYKISRKGVNKSKTIRTSVVSKKSDRMVYNLSRNGGNRTEAVIAWSSEKRSRVKFREYLKELDTSANKGDWDHIEQILVEMNEQVSRSLFVYQKKSIHWAHNSKSIKTG